ncbi:DNA alkylation repair protein [Candidatus Woesebacteria bacterium]|nr:DNA alkylation repair protein [Candidatus Woesebacteria bacterium]
MNKHHRELLEKIKKFSNKGKASLHPDSYVRSTHFSYHLQTSDSKNIAKEFKNKYKDLNLNEFILLLNSLYLAPSYSEKAMGSRLLGLYSKLRDELDPGNIDTWLNDLVGWVEVDGLSQSNFTGKEILSKWNDWSILLKKLNKDKNINKRRASLVLLTEPTSHMPDKRISDLAFENIDALKSEKDILITKAISWILRSLIKYHIDEVENYMNKNDNVLPKVALRETRNKLMTGRKSGKT